MMPISLYKRKVDMDRYEAQVNVLVASTSKMDRDNYEIFMLSQFPNSRIDSGSYDCLNQQLSRSRYDVLVLDNDAFFVDKNPALDYLIRAGEFVDRNRIIVTASISSQDLSDRARNAGARFIEKGRWKTLADVIRQIAEKKYVVKAS